MQAITSYRRFSIATVVVTLGVILWGAFVRASGSGAGCGSHWPTCNGEVIPRAQSIETVIELTHRATSGFAGLLVLAQLVWAFRIFPRGHLARTGAALSMAFMISEGLVGAGLVLFELVAHDASLARGGWVSMHLVNTFLLVASMVLTVLWAEREPPARPRFGGAQGLAVVAALVASVVVGVTGAVAALGDTLFPADSLRAGLAHDLAPTAHLFVRLRGLHPFVAVALAVGLLVLASTAASRRPDARGAAQALAVLVVAQVCAGLVNLLLLAPVGMQLVHLLLADLVWIALVVLATRTLSGGGARAIGSA